MATIAGSRVLNEDRPVRWGSWLGLGVAFFLIAALLNVLAAVFVPLVLHLQGAAALGSSLVWSSDGDTELLGRSLKGGYVVLLFYIPFALGTIAAGIGLLRRSVT